MCPTRNTCSCRGRLLQTLHDRFRTSLARLRRDGGQRLTGFVLALLAEAGLVLVVLSLGWTDDQPKPPGSRLVSMALSPEAEASKDPPRKPARAALAPSLERPRPPAATQAAPTAAPLAAPAPPTPIIPVAPGQMAAFDLSNLPRQPARPAPPGKGQMGPPNLGVAGDSKRVGTAPGGQPMYAAAWYREPYDDELRGYLSTADGPGWALIACRTAPDFRVEDCVGLDEYPAGSQIKRAVLAAAWQFRVRPPRIGGVSQVGEWVRIRIDYTQRRP